MLGGVEGTQLVLEVVDAMVVRGRVTPEER